MRSGGFWIGIGLLVGGLFLLASLRSVDLASALQVAAGARPAYLLLAVAASFAFMLVKSWRWCLLLSPITKLRTLSVLPAVYTGTAANLIISHAGEVARAALLAQRHGLSTSALLGSIAVERLFDIVAVLMYCGLLVVATDHLAPVVASASYVAIALVAFAMALALLGLHYTEESLRLAQRLLGFLSPSWQARILKQLRAAITGLSALREARKLLGVIVQSLLQWGCILIAIHASVRSLGLTPEPISSVAVLVLMVVGLSLPAAPVHVGTTQLGFTIGLAAFAVTAPQAFAASIIYTLFVLVPMLVPGLAAVTLTRGRLSWGVLRARSVDDVPGPVSRPNE
jgi:glycosyltransferase 2 family protein